MIYRISMALSLALYFFDVSSAYAQAQLDLARAHIKHVIIIMQENRSFDHYFGTYPGADGLPMTNGVPDACIPVDAPGQPCNHAYHDTSDINGGGPHGTEHAKADIDGGKMDGFYREAAQGRSACQPNTPNPNCRPSGAVDVMGYHDRGDIPNYWAYADNFVLHDHMFEPVASWSLPVHLFMVSAWSAKCRDTKDPMSCRNDEAYKFDQGRLMKVADLLHVGGLVSDLESRMHGEEDHQAALVEQPADWRFAWTDITWLLHRRGVSWGYYVAKGDQPDCDDDEMDCPRRPQSAATYSIWNPLPSFTTVKQDNELANVRDSGEFFKAAKAGTLPAISWVIPGHETSEHPPAKVTDGQAYVTRVINAVMKSPDWQDCAIFVAWDDWGGFYDHVVPPSVDGNGYGLRVPSLVVGPYAKRGFIDHQTLSFDAYLKLIEDLFLDGQRLDPKTDGRPDPRPTVRETVPQLGDLLADFDFSQPPRPPLVLEERPRTALH